MSRIISERAAFHFLNGDSWHEKNTRTAENRLFLHGNEIARLESGRLYINLQGWNTSTTRERLNALPGVRVTQKNFLPYLNGQEISDSGWYKVN